ncbi:unnamed protein product [Acanthocheilonema viteae]|uniref:Kelch domain-containing protein n=1 Tax=Acanthocheilonema viteae TaxID=6277 RepID=A0A498SVE7_ACAVI|nr:unnamed protein product [Acanthocheilonema viteae]
MSKPLVYTTTLLVDYRWKFVPTTPFVSNPSEQLIDGSGMVYKPYGEIPSLRVGHTVVAYQGKVYLWGGCCPATRFIYPKIYCFDPVQRTWSVIPSANEPPIPRIKHTAVVYNDTMFIYGGIENDSATNGIILCNNICAYHFETRKWRYIIIYGGISVERFQHTACVIDGKMYVYGGIDAEQWTLCLDIIDLQQGYCQRPVTKGRRPRGIRAACSCIRVYNSKMYIFGGYRFRSEHYITTLHRFDPKTMVWQRIKPFGLRGPSGRERHCGVVVGDCAYVFGGEL